MRITISGVGKGLRVAVFATCLLVTKVAWAQSDPIAGRAHPDSISVQKVVAAVATGRPTPSPAEPNLVRGQNDPQSKFVDPLAGRSRPDSVRIDKVSADLPDGRPLPAQTPQNLDMTRGQGVSVIDPLQGRPKPDSVRFDAGAGG
jgi:hypothetical protein